MSRREHVKPVLRAFLHAKSADLLFLNNHKIPWLMYTLSYCLFQSELGLNQLQRTKISKKNSFLRFVCQIDRFFSLVEDSQTKIPTNTYFGRKVEPPRAKNLRIAISHSFLTGLVFPFVETFLRVYYCLRLKEFKISEILLHRLEFRAF